MSRELTDGHAAASERPHLEEVYFVAFHFASETLRVCSRDRDVVWDGHTWLGKGRVGAIEPIEEGSQLEARSIAMSLSAIPSGMLGTALDPAEYKNRQCEIWRGLFEPDVVDFDFTKGTLVPQIGADQAEITFARAGADARRFNSAGALEAVSADQARFNYDVSVPAPRGLQIEEARTNSIRNNTGQGAAAGSPGTAPTNWTMPATQDGLSRQIVGVSTEDGIDYVEVRYSGTASAGGSIQIHPETTTQVVAAGGQRWSGSFFMRLVGGSLNGITSNVVRVSERDAGGTLLNSSQVTFTPTSAALDTQRQKHSRTLTEAGTARVSLHWIFAYSNGAAVDFTVRIGLPQLEQGGLVTSPIRTTTAVVSRNRDDPTISPLGSVFDPAKGTLVVEFDKESDDLASPNARLVEFSDGTLNNRFGLHVNTTSEKPGVLIITGGVTQSSFDLQTYTYGTIGKVAFAWEENNVAASFMGGAVTTDTAASIPAVTNLDFGHVNGAAPLNGHLRRVTYYPRRLSNAELVIASQPGQGLMPGQGERLVEPVGPFIYRMDSLDFELGEICSVRLTAHSRLEDWQRPRVRRYNDADQQAEYPGDRGFEYAEGMVNAEFQW